jgi:hypothetical protein
MAREDLAHLARHRLVAHEIRRHEHRVGHSVSARSAGIAERTPNCAPRSWRRRPPSARRARRPRPAGRAGGSSRCSTDA